jgi:hypothetical protein
MIAVYVFVALGIAFAIAAIAIGREARRLDAEPPQPVFSMTEAVDWVAEQLPFEVSAELSHEDVRRIMDWNLEYFRIKGASGNGHALPGAAPVVVGGAETVDYVLGQARAVGAEYTPPQVHAVLDAQMRYLEAIGAIGPEVPPEGL